MCVFCLEQVKACLQLTPLSVFGCLRSCALRRAASLGNQGPLQCSVTASGGAFVVCASVTEMTIFLVLPVLIIFLTWHQDPLMKTSVFECLLMTSVYASHLSVFLASRNSMTKNYFAPNFMLFKIDFWRAQQITVYSSLIETLALCVSVNIVSEAQWTCRHTQLIQYCRCGFTDQATQLKACLAGWGFS